MPDSLKGVDDDQLCIRVIVQIIVQLFFQSAAQQFRICGNFQHTRFSAADIHQTPLDPLVGIFQTEIEHTAFPCLELPYRHTKADAMSHPENQPGLADFRCACQKIESLSQHLFNQFRVIRELHIHQIISTDGVQEADLDSQDPAHVFDSVSFRPEAMTGRYIIHHVPISVAVIAAPHKIGNDAGMLPAMRADGQFRFIVRCFGCLQILNKTELYFSPQHCQSLYCHKITSLRTNLVFHPE